MILSLKEMKIGKKKKQHTRGESICSGDGGGGRTKKISPKDAMHLVVVL